MEDEGEGWWKRRRKGEREGRGGQGVEDVKGGRMRERGGGRGGGKERGRGEEVAEWKGEWWWKRRSKGEREGRGGRRCGRERTGGRR